MIKLFNQWSVSLIVLGAVLTLVWLILLVWFPLHLMQVL